MAPVGLVVDLALVVVPMLVVSVLVLVGPRQFVRALSGWRWRVAAITLPVTILALVLLLRVTTRDVLSELSQRVVGTPFTGSIFSIEYVLFETNPVVFLQSFQTDVLTSYFSFIYVYGYVFLLVFPMIAYFVLSEMDDLNTLLIAFTANYAIGLIFYTLIIAYGPRNYNPLLFENLLYETFPQVQNLTLEVNEKSNVFPSLHTSLSMTTLILAWKTRETYPLWVPISGVFAISVVLSTMYLGIHWFTDVAAGTLLAMASVYIGRVYTRRDVNGFFRTVLRRNVEHIKTSLDR